MQDIGSNGLVAIGSLVVAFAALMGTRAKDTKAEAARHQLVDDKLDRNNELARETRDAVRDIERKLDDHAQRLVKVEADIDTLYRRVGRIEKSIDVRFAPELSE